MSALKRSQRVEIRVTEYEKAAWAEAAGGARRVSEWLRALANSAANGPKPEPLTPPLGDGRISAKKTGPVTTLDAVGGEDQGKASLPVVHEPRVIVKQPGRAQVKASPTPAECPRWMHHRPGTYCGSCKKSY